MKGEILLLKEIRQRKNKSTKTKVKNKLHSLEEKVSLVKETDIGEE